MSVIIVLIGFSLLVAVGFLIAFIWSVKTGQYDDDYTPSVRILFDDSIPKTSEPIDNENNRDSSKLKVQGSKLEVQSSIDKIETT